MTTANQIVERDGESRVVSLFRKVIGFPARVLMRIRAAFNTAVPVGYEDENGFHYGKEPHPNCVNLQEYLEVQDSKNRTETAGGPAKVSDGGTTSVSSPATSRTAARG